MLISGVYNGVILFFERAHQQTHHILIFFCGIIAVESVFQFFCIKKGESSQQAVPDGEYRTIVTIRIGLFPVVMHFMHIGRNEDITEGFVCTLR